MNIILICGKRWSGRNTFAKFLQSKSRVDFEYLYGPRIRKGDYTVVTFFHSLNECVEVLTKNKDNESCLSEVNIGLYPSTDISMNLQSFSYRGTFRDYTLAISKSVRNIDQDCFVDSIRSIDSDFFVKTMYQRYKNSSNTIIVTDWNYLNEYEFLRRVGANIQTVRVVRENNPYYSSEYSSHRAMLEVDYSERILDHFQTDIVVRSL